MQVRALDAAIGAAASVKLFRSIVVKGTQVLLTEAALAACSEGLEDEFLRAIADLFPESDLRARTQYNIARMLKHGERRAEEMQAAVAMLRSFGLPCDMSLAAVHWEQRITGLGLSEDTPAAETLSQVLQSFRLAESATEGTVAPINKSDV